MVTGELIVDLVATLVGALLLFLASTVVFDAIHFALHRFASSPRAPLRALGELHAAHHAFMDRELRINEAHRAANLRRHVVPEFLTQLSVSALCLLLLPAPVVAGAVLLQGLVFALILRGRGNDINHHEIDVLPAYRPLYFCVPPYHALHHIHPDSYFSSYIKTLDHLLGTGLELRGRRIAVTGAREGFGSHLTALLEECGAGPVDPVEEAALEDAALAERLGGVDILVLCHGEAALESGDPALLARRRDSTRRIVAAFRQIAERRRFPPELWSLDREGRPGSSDARRYFLDEGLIYRHILLPEAAAMPRERAARIALSLARRGLNYLPLRLTWQNLRDYLAFARAPIGG